MAKQDNISPKYVARLLPLGFLSPRIVERLLEGDHSTLLSAEGLTRRLDVPSRWEEQSIERPIPASNRTLADYTPIT